MHRQEAEARGRRSETLAAWALRLKGYRILGRRLKTPQGEIDMVALPLFGPVCFIEVKARAAHDMAVLSVGMGRILGGSHVAGHRSLGSAPRTIAPWVRNPSHGWASE